jgi:hypothetical protein
MTYEPCTCGHAKGDHKSNGSRFPHPLIFGVCLRCGCREYFAAFDDAGHPDAPALSNEETT